MQAGERQELPARFLRGPRFRQAVASVRWLGVLHPLDPEAASTVWVYPDDRVELAQTVAQAKAVSDARERERVMARAIYPRYGVTV
jgi:hypothetical protein